MRFNNAIENNEKRSDSANVIHKGACDDRSSRKKPAIVIVVADVIS